MVGEKKTWLEELREEIEHVEIINDVKCGPKKEVQPGEKVIGEMSDYEKKFYIYIQKHADEMESLAEKVASGEIKNSDDPRLSRFAELSDECMLLEDILFHTINHRLSLWLNFFLGLRRGWKIVTRDMSRDLPLGIGAVRVKAPKGWM